METKEAFRRQDSFAINEELLKAISRLSNSKQKKLLQIATAWLSDERKHNRRPCYLEVSYSDYHRIGHGTIQNISSDGAFVTSKVPFPPGHGVVMTFEVPRTSKPLKINGKIAWKDENGMGINFDRKIEGLTEQ
jgi:Tfp pilus assembly protein PilZ